MPMISNSSEIRINVPFNAQFAFTYLSFQIVHFQFLGLFLNGNSHLSPILGQMLDPLEGRNELETHETFLVSLDMLEQELVLGDVGITEVKLHLLDNGLTQLIIRILKDLE